MSFPLSVGCFFHFIRVAFLKSFNVPGPPCPLGNVRGLCTDKLLKSLPA